MHVIASFLGSLALAHRALLAAACLAPFACGDGQAATSQWSGQKQGRVRLIAGEVASGAGPPSLYAGVHIKLEPGWKTYWRAPGEAGVPPQFDWQGSTNVGEVRVLYPAPSRFTDAGLDSFGYQGEVVLPVRLAPQEAGKPVRLRLSLEYGVCKDICVPMQSNLALDWTPGGGGEGKLIGAHLARVPGRSTKGAPEITAVRSDLDARPPRLLLEARFPGGTAGADLILETAPGEIGPMAKAMGEVAPGVVRFEARPDSAKEAAGLKGRELIVTLVGDRGQAETVVRVP